MVMAEFFKFGVETAPNCSRNLPQLAIKFLIKLKHRQTNNTVKVLIQ
jgi:hypothetical protein